MKQRHILIFVFTILWIKWSFAQYPQYVIYDNENGLPSNEVYSIVQDAKGFIWIGCDAGLFKFDGSNYTAYKSSDQQSKSITGLTLSASGKLYCYNFQSQLFCLNNNKLELLSNSFSNISDITADKLSHIYVTHIDGISIFNETKNRWKNYTKFDIDCSTASPRINSGNEVRFLTSNAIARLSNGQVKMVKSDLLRFPGTFVMENVNDEHYIFSTFQSTVFKEKNGEINHLNNPALSTTLNNRKVTNAVFLKDKFLWITTYKGLIQFNPQTQQVKLLYPNISFSDVLIDREGNYWFTTIQHGMMRVPNLDYLVWNKDNEQLPTDKITKITTDGTNIFFSTVDGIIGRLNSKTNNLSTFKTEQHADVQSLNYIAEEDRLYFNVNTLFYLHKDQLKENELEARSIKSIHRIAEEHLVLTSFGTYVQGEATYKLSEIWSRDLQFDTKNNLLFIATNKGLQLFKQQNRKWKLSKTVFDGIQILSLDFDKQSNLCYALSFDGQIYAVKNGTTSRKVAKLPSSVQVNKLKYYRHQLFVATNKGIWVLSLKNKSWSKLNTLYGLASNNVQDLLILNGDLWLATGKGVQRIPLNRMTEKPRATVFLNNPVIQNLTLNHKESLVLFPEVIHFSSNGRLEYTYRINRQDWIKLPASIQQISIQNLPTGKFSVELKAIDFLGRDSKNSILISGYVKPPFYKTWWFLSICAVLLLLLVYALYRRQLAKVKKAFKQQNELNIAKLTAIRSQMNPHFIFNSLNAIQDLILQKRTVESYDYVILFSELVRNALNYSTKEFIPIQKEIEFLDTYLQLEKLRFKEDFTYQIVSDIQLEIDVPTLLIQPFVENALLHGLLHKEGKKELLITFIFANDQLVCVIEDNGIGRKKAKLISERQGNTHESFALQAIQKRLDIINEQQKQPVGSFTYEDCDPSQINVGTRVTIHLPFKRHF